MNPAAILDAAVQGAGGRQALAKRALDEAAPPPVPFCRLDLAGLLDSPPPPTQFWWEGLVPAGAVTLLGAHGDTGKSMVSLMLACSLCAGEPLFGITTRRARVAYFSAEDPERVVRQRLHTIARGLDIDPTDLDERLHVLDATGGDPVLFHEMGRVDGRPGVTTSVYSALREYLDEHQIDVLIVDNASDVFDASENDRAKVRGFMRALTQLAQPERAVVLLAHVNRSTASGLDGSSGGKAEGYSGSTAWHNSSRSRLYLHRNKDGDLVLEHHKNNLGQQGRHDPINLTWPREGLPQIDKPLEGVVQHIADRSDTRALLRLIHEFSGRGEWVSTAVTSRTHAGQVMRLAPGFPTRLSNAEVFELLRGAERRGWLERTQWKEKGSGKHGREVWRLTASGQEVAGVPTVRTVPTTEVDATPHPVPTVPTSAPGGVGGTARTQVGALGAGDAP